MPTPSDASVLSAAAEIALCRATLYGALALGFRPPTREALDRLATPDAAAALAAAAHQLETQTGAAGLAPHAAALSGLPADLDTVARQFRRLFGHTARGAVPAYETEYGCEALFQQPQELSDLAGFLRAFGLTLRPELHERVDHVSCECELVAFLAWKEAYALHAGDEAMRAATAHATVLFLRDHLGRFVPAFCRRLAREDPGALYGALGDLLHAVVAADCRRLAIACGSEALGLRPDPAAVAAPMGCDADTDCTSCPATSGLS